jgi:hypothetical protein
MNTSTTYKDADEAYDAGTEWIDCTRRSVKLDYLLETSTQEFKDKLLDEIVQWMSEDDFREFFNCLRRNWNVLTPQELDYALNS